MNRAPLAVLIAAAALSFPGFADEGAAAAQQAKLITQAQATGDPAVASLQAELRNLQDLAQAVRGMVTGR